jgi:hypothetical protein
MSLPLLDKTSPANRAVPEREQRFQPLSFLGMPSVDDDVCAERLSTIQMESG